MKWGLVLLVVLLLVVIPGDEAKSGGGGGRSGGGRSSSSSSRSSGGRSSSRSTCCGGSNSASFAYRRTSGYYYYHTGSRWSGSSTSDGDFDPWLNAVVAVYMCLVMFFFHAIIFSRALCVKRAQDWCCSIDSRACCNDSAWFYISLGVVFLFHLIGFIVIFACPDTQYPYLAPQTQLLYNTTDFNTTTVFNATDPSLNATVALYNLTDWIGTPYNVTVQIEKFVNLPDDQCITAGAIVIYIGTFFFLVAGILACCVDGCERSGECEFSLCDGSSDDKNVHVEMRGRVSVVLGDEPQPHHEWTPGWGQKLEAGQDELYLGRQFSGQHPPQSWDYSDGGIYEYQFGSAGTYHQITQVQGSALDLPTSTARVYEHSLINGTWHLKMRPNGPAGRDCVTCTNYPIPPAHLQPNVYFEVTVVSLRGGRSLAVGLITHPYPSFRLPGWHPNSVGYHADDGCVFINDDADGQRYGSSYGNGDTVGVLLTRVPGRPMCVVQFTLNGVVLSRRDIRAADYFPAIGCDDDVEVHVNLGGTAFRCDQYDCDEYGVCSLINKRHNQAGSTLLGPTVAPTYSAASSTYMAPPPAYDDAGGL